ncbi:hypothetical protein DPMN_145285 [Dreissena polymorpha]|uniref:Uncharacterized protein n=1 Tax=Dreissena polymorpha TaxID=45954 RepID=A0A9D4IYN6_DREPO|nr:hypothetical protein DPMN_145285 [Dreissena polymorpha]
MDKGLTFDLGLSRTLKNDYGMNTAVQGPNQYGSYTDHLRCCHLFGSSRIYTAVVIQHLYGAQSPSPQYKHGCIWQCRTVPDRSETIRGLLECVSVDGLPKTIHSVTTRRPLRNRSIFMNDLEESFETPINSRCIYFRNMTCFFSEKGFMSHFLKSIASSTAI